MAQIWETLPAFWALFSHPVMLGFIGVSFAYLANIYRSSLREPDKQGYADLKAVLKEKTEVDDRYEILLAKLLKWADSFFEGKPYQEKSDELPSGWGHKVLCWFYWRPYDYKRENETRSKNWTAPPWSFSSFDKSLLLAVFYPFASAVLFWVILGDGGELGEALRLNASQNDVFRYFTAIIAVLIGVLFLKTMNSEGWQFYLGVLVTISLGISAIFISKFLFPTESAVAVAVAVAVSVAGAGAVTFAVSVTVSVAGAFAFAFAFAFVGAFAFAGAGAVAVAFAFAGASAYKRENNTILAVSILYSVTAFCLLFFTSGAEVSPSRFAFLLGLVLIPIVNAPFDWFSFGLTRWLLRKNLANRSNLWRLLYSVIDGVLAVIALIILAITLVFVLELANKTVNLGGMQVPLLDVTALLSDIAENPKEKRHYWVYFALFTTLLPTLIHLAICVFSFLTTRVYWLNEFILELMETKIEHDYGGGVVEYTAGLLALRWLITLLLTVFVALLAFNLLVAATGLGKFFVEMLIEFHSILLQVFY